MKTYIDKELNVLFYHSGCNDGRMAAGVAHSFLEGVHSFPINYGAKDILPEDYLGYLLEITTKEQVDLTAAKEIWFVDFCPTPAQLEALSQFGLNVTVIDHHKSAYDDMVAAGHLMKPYKPEGTVGIFIDWEKCVFVEGDQKDGVCYVEYFYSELDSGALMAYKFFSYYLDKDKDIPNFIQWVSDRDTWKFNYPESKPFAAGLSRYGSVKPGMLVKMLTPEKVSEIVATGQALEEANISYVDKQLRNRITVVPILNKDSSSVLMSVSDQSDVRENARIALYNSTHLQSALGDAYFKSQTDVHMIAIYTVVDDTKVIYSVRSREGVDSLWLAKRFGGGGHSNANGFTTDLQTLCFTLTNEYMAY